MGGRKWKDWEIEFLKDNYPIEGSKFCSEILKRDYQAVQKQAQKLNIKRHDGRKLYISHQGYLVFEPVRGHKIQVHRLLMEEILGRPLTADEIVHHKDNNKLNNNPSNLEIMTRAEHINIHRDDLKR